MDSKGRITLPIGVRKIVGRSVFKVELAGKDTIILRVFEDRRELVEKVRDIKLVGDKERAHIDAATVKDYYGGVKH
ncbi:MAG: hypothetical protein AOA65_0769 [Candidatus Bathyarchaeota archaeon BA1]|nr:MAG: hypothetical protein AOA65_0769 [Candidatus Bathyarchaeota archaeon BA1]